jgi:hypothetical protein
MYEFLQKMGNVDRRVIFLIIGLVVLLPLIFPLGLPVKATKTTIDVYNAVEAIPDGEKVLVSFEYGPSTKPEIHPMAFAILRHLFDKGHPVIIMCLWPDGLFMAQEVIHQVAELEYDLKYGVDYVNLGYRPGNEAIIKGITRGFESVYTIDTQGMPLSTIPIMQDVETVGDVSFIFSLSAGYPGSVEWVQYAADPLQIPFSSGTTSIQVNEVLPYVQAGQMQGIIAGMPAAAEYEGLIIQHGHFDMPGDATRFMDAQSIAHLVIVLFIILGNTAYYLKRKKEQKY